MTDLNTLVGLTDITLQTGVAINDRGQVLASTMVIPEPEIHFMLLAGLGLLGMITRRRLTGTAGMAQEGR